MVYGRNHRWPRLLAPPHTQSHTHSYTYIHTREERDLICRVLNFGVRNGGVDLRFCVFFLFVCFYFLWIKDFAFLNHNCLSFVGFVYCNSLFPYLYSLVLFYLTCLNKVYKIIRWCKFIIRSGIHTFSCVIDFTFTITIVISFAWIC